jgi:hypothetical protein
LATRRTELIIHYQTVCRRELVTFGSLALNPSQLQKMTILLRPVVTSILIERTYFVPLNETFVPYGQIHLIPNSFMMLQLSPTSSERFLTFALV